MDVFHVGASAPKAPESKSVDRGDTRTNGRSVKAPNGDAFASSADGAAVSRHVARLASTNDIREDVITSISELLGKGLLDTPDAARRAAQGILDA
jgi:hypothetical protein